MSSTYRILCMNHDPAIDSGLEWQSSDEALAAAANPVALDAHAKCDVLIGRYSYPLVEVCCPPRADWVLHPRLQHSNPIWVDAYPLRLLYAALVAAPDARVKEAAEPLTGGCWSWKRLHCLRMELGFEEGR